MTSRLKILVDTSFLLPALGIDVEDEVLECIKYFHKVDVHYTELSLLEAFWKILKIISMNDMDIVIEGLNAIRITYKLVIIPSTAYISAFKLYREGHKDFIDNLLYSTSRELNLKFLTIDYDFINFLRSRKYLTDNVLTPREFLRIVS
ncbi:MAG: hypothetical protein B6V02_01470 [Thermoprotei archaeon ex4572_64]|nr:MAG: hypothetical protein B6V02_01470 [Thermoprotei archaeon ex4572_64]